MKDQHETLDPSNWEDVRALAHRIIDEAVDYTRDVRDRPVWQDMPESARDVFSTPAPREPRPLEDVYQTLTQNMLPYPMGNIHPRFWMWYMGTSNFTGALGDFLAAILGSNLGGGNHAATAIDRQVVDWMKEMSGFPASASGTLVSGGSMANLIGLTVARNRKAGVDVRANGLAGIGKPLRFYASDQVHGCHQVALETLGLGAEALVRVPTRDDFTMDVGALKKAIEWDRAAGLTPACVIATAGTVNTGSIDDLEAIGALCRQENLWFHVDGCIGALVNIAPESAPLVAGMERADSLALDPHKWLHAPFEVGCALVRDSFAHIDTFSLTPEYLEPSERGVASGDWPNNLGLQTSRGFRALKVWMALQEHGVPRFGRLIDQDIGHARYLTGLITAQPSLTLMAPTALNIVCFRYDPGGMDEADLKSLNTEIMLQMQESGVAAVSDTTLRGRYTLRAALTNHRTVPKDLDLLTVEVLRLGDELCGDKTARRA